MSRNIVAFAGGAFVAGALLLSPLAAHATIMQGSFTGTMTAGIDEDNFFGGGVNSDLTGESITGTFVYDTTLFGAPTLSGGTANYPGTSSGALTITVTLGSASYTFQDRANSSIYLDPSSTSEVTLQSDDTATGVSTTFLLDVGLPDTPFVTSNSLTGTYNASALDDSALQNSLFQILNTGNVVSGASFNVDSISVQQQALPTPEPASMAVLGIGLAGIAAVRRRRAKA